MKRTYLELAWEKFLMNDEQKAHQLTAKVFRLGERKACSKDMKGFYGADSSCARPKGHRGICYQVWQTKDWVDPIFETILDFTSKYYNNNINLEIKVPDAEALHQRQFIGKEESINEKYEKDAAEFLEETGIMAPGKDSAFPIESDEVRRLAWKAFLKDHRKKTINRLISEKKELEANFLFLKVAIENKKIADEFMKSNPGQKALAYLTIAEHKLEQALAGEPFDIKYKKWLEDFIEKYGEDMKKLAAEGD